MLINEVIKVHMGNHFIDSLNTRIALIKSAEDTDSIYTEDTGKTKGDNSFNKALQWAAILASIYLGAVVLKRLGLLPSIRLNFPAESDPVRLLNREFRHSGLRLPESYPAPGGRSWLLDPSYFVI